ncbi:hypothetical protein CQZ93_03535 [Ochrobactrum vermis]|nr:hypothetical protein CQZ93_03535 [Ochrobactrum vermis]
MSADADGYKLTGFPALILGGGTATATVQYREPFQNLVKIGSVDVSLGATSLAQIREILGGSTHMREALGLKTSWLCYEITKDNLSRRIWFISDGFSNQEAKKAILSLIATEVADDKAQDCSTPKIDLTEIVLPVPALDDDRKKLEDRFGATDAKKFIRYANEQRNSEAIVKQSLVYRLDGDQITGVGFSQATAR